MIAAELLARLAKVKRTGDDRWLAVCPAHEDSRPSLSIRELTDGRVLLHCFGGCAANDVMAAIGLELCDLYPPKPITDRAIRGERAPYVGADALRALQLELLFVVFLAADIAEGKPADEILRRRALTAAGRILTAIDLAMPRRGRRQEKRQALRIAVAELAKLQDAA